MVNLTALGIIATLLMHHTTAMLTSLRIEFASRLDGLQSEVHRRLSAIESDLKDFFKVQAEFDKRLARIEDKLNIK